MPATAEEQSLLVSEIEAIRKQLESMIADDLLRTSKRSVTFLRYIVEETLNGRAGDLKERTIGVNVFGKALTYDTSLDHVVRTAAMELRRRLAMYYSREEHQDELRILILPGSYVPQFGPSSHAPDPQVAPLVPGLEALAQPGAREETAPQPAPALVTGRRVWWAALATRARVGLLAALLCVVVGLVTSRWSHRELSMQQKFWAPLLDSSGPILIGVGDVPGGPPVIDGADGTAFFISPARPGPPTVPFADAVTIARIGVILASFDKDFLIRRENSRSFSDLRERPVILIGAFNNDWSLQLTHDLRFSLALDSARQLLYIRDKQHPESRAWFWDLGPHPEERHLTRTTPLHDYALISRILDSQTGHDVVVLGGLYAYGTQAAGEFLASRDMESLPPGALLDQKNEVPSDRDRHHCNRRYTRAATCRRD